ncbi:ATP-dependent Clp protease adaptor ClpS [Marinilabiliaceae bacterium ANBcel2]|nr:ATP-dependent Clp protease adaptor ClpS [Marinilabiliaceae bacterium ANBcel2]
MVPLDKPSEQDNFGNRESEERVLILHNDNINTFDHVIDVLVNTCSHDELQAEQCALITHTKGYCEVKRGLFIQLEELQNRLTNKNLYVTIE